MLEDAVLLSVEYGVLIDRLQTAGPVLMSRIEASVRLRHQIHAIALTGWVMHVWVES